MLKYLVTEQKTVNGNFESLVTSYDTKDEAETAWFYACWYNMQNKTCSAFTVTLQGPQGEGYATKTYIRPAEAAAEAYSPGGER